MLVFKKTGWEAYPRPIEGVKTKGICEPQSQLPVHTFFFSNKKKEKKERETPASFHIGDMIAFPFSHL